MDRSTGTQTAERLREKTEITPSLSSKAVGEISDVLKPLLADVYTLYLKTKNFHWHLSGPHFRDYHLLFDEQAAQILDMSDEIAERARKLGGDTLRSISDITRYQRLEDNNEPNIRAEDMVAELYRDNRQLVQFLRSSHDICVNNNDVATSSMIEVWIDQTERRAWFLAQTIRE